MATPFMADLGLPPSGVSRAMHRALDGQLAIERALAPGLRMRHELERTLEMERQHRAAMPHDLGPTFALKQQLEATAADRARLAAQGLAQHAAASSFAASTQAMIDGARSVLSNLAGFSESVLAQVRRSDSLLATVHLAEARQVAAQADMYAAVQRSQQRFVDSIGGAALAGAADALNAIAAATNAGAAGALDRATLASIGLGQSTLTAITAQIQVSTALAAQLADADTRARWQSARDEHARGNIAVAVDEALRFERATRGGASAPPSDLRPGVDTAIAQAAAEVVFGLSPANAEAVRHDGTSLLAVLVAVWQRTAERAHGLTVEDRRWLLGVLVPVLAWLLPNPDTVRRNAKADRESAARDQQAVAWHASDSTQREAIARAVAHVPQPARPTYITTRDVPLREEPDSGARRLAGIPRGQALTVCGQMAPWLAVEVHVSGTTGVQTGWVHERYTRPAPTAPDPTLP